MSTKTPPVCCGQEAKWVMNGISLQYWFCTGCKEEVKEAGSLPPLEMPTSYSGKYFIVPTYSPPAPQVAVPKDCGMGNHTWGPADACLDCGAHYLDVMAGKLGKGIP